VQKEQDGPAGGCVITTRKKGDNGNPLYQNGQQTKAIKTILLINVFNVQRSCHSLNKKHLFHCHSQD